MNRSGAGLSKNLYLDEIALKKGHGNFETVISTENRVLTLIEGKASETLQGCLKRIPGIERIQYVSMDMCASFAHAVREVMPKAQIVIDRFHLIRHLNDKLEKTRKHHYGKLDEKRRKRFSKVNWLLFKDYRSLHKDEKRLVRDYLRLAPETGQIYWLIQYFRKILTHAWQDRDAAYMALYLWCEKAKKYMKRLVTTIWRWWDGILNACMLPISNARQEGINNKIKLIKRQGFGYRNRETFKLKVLSAFNP